MTQPSATALCHCGLPLHYASDMKRNYAEHIIKHGGEYAVFQSRKTGKYYRVQRHYYLLHGFAWDNLDNLGFEEVDKEGKNINDKN